MSGKNLLALDQKMREIWREILENSNLIRAVHRGELDRDLYGRYLIETYHYTSYNSRNQALVGVRTDLPSVRYQQFCLTHAREECGHELMALHDYKALELKLPNPIPAPLPETEVFIAYIDWISRNGNPLRRLGYSFWAEDIYHILQPTINALQEGLNLENRQLTFFREHAQIDQKHRLLVRELIERNCRVPEDWNAIEEVLCTSSRLMSRVLEAVYRSGKETPNGARQRNPSAQRSGEKALSF